MTPIALYFRSALCSPTDDGCLIESSEGAPSLFRRIRRNVHQGTRHCLVSGAYWDCVGDLLVACDLDSTQQTPNAPATNKWIYLYSPPEFSSRYFTPDSLLQLFTRLNDHGWHIKIRKDSENCMNNGIFQECPAYDALMTAPGSDGFTLTGSSDHPARDYSHPIDGAIIKVLDLPLVKDVFKTTVDTMVDAQFGQTLATGIQVTSQTFPQLDQIITHCARTLGIRRPYAVVSSAYHFNACTTGSDENPYLIIGAAMVQNFTPEQLQFVIGHECGHIAMGHMVFHSVISMASNLTKMIPLIGETVCRLCAYPLNAWSRRSEVTADRAGLLCCGNIETAKYTLMRLAAPMMENMDVQQYVDASERFRKGGFLRNLGELKVSHPLLPKRIEALDLFAQSDLYYSLTGQTAPADAITRANLNERIEALIRVL